ncbi:MAG: hypothetical protein JXN64_01315 [Spirochaetes bacterium]|nr:hypothetical protein [Spirochaetota bacterium]
MIKLKFFLIIILLCLPLSIIFAQDFNKLIAYPVPFKPSQGQNLTIGFGKPETVYSSVKLTFKIYDINGDSVYSRKLNNVPFLWNGRNGRGKIVSPGLYILKIEIEDLNNNQKYTKKIIRILVN